MTMATIVYRSRAAIEVALQVAARNAGVTVDASGAVAAFSREASVVNAAIVGQDESPDALRRGVNLLFVHLALPSGEIEQHSKVAIPDGFYIVKLYVDESMKTGRATLHSQNGTEVAALETIVEDAKHVHPVSRGAISVSGHVNRCGVFFDADWYKYSITVNVIWC
jgi:xanthine dehydrogenase iron-sulfur cluster and FAD-binding subunit A